MQQTKLTQKRGKKKPKDVWDKINVPKIVCIHMIGENHNETHRMGAGVIVMTCGVLIAHSTAHIFIIEYIGDIVGYCIHAIGGIPFVEHIIEKVKRTEKMKSEPVLDEIEEKLS